MDLKIVFPDTDFGSFIFRAHPNTLVDDAINSLVDEWLIEPEKVDIAFAGKVLQRGTKISSHSLAEGAEIEVIAKRNVYTKIDLLNSRTRKEIEILFGHNSRLICYVDASSMITAGRLETGINLLPKTVKRVVFVNCSNATSIDDDFLSASSGLTHIDLSGFTNIESIGSCFLSYCASLSSIDLSAFTQVTTIGESFLFSCSSLRNVDLTPLGGLSSIKASFMTRCSGIKQINLSPLTSVSSIGAHFLAYCTSLVSLDISVFDEVTHVGCNFLYGCDSLTSIDVRPLRGAKHIGDLFLKNCNKLTVDTSELQLPAECQRQLTISSVSPRTLQTIGSSDLVYDEPAPAQKKEKDKPDEKKKESNFFMLLRRTLCGGKGDTK